MISTSSPSLNSFYTQTENYYIFEDGSFKLVELHELEQDHHQNEFIQKNIDIKNGKNNIKSTNQTLIIFLFGSLLCFNRFLAIY